MERGKQASIIRVVWSGEAGDLVRFYNAKGIGSVKSMRGYAIKSWSRVVPAKYYGNAADGVHRPAFG